jgi:Branched-chain amino acid transport system / permease component.
MYFILNYTKIGTYCNAIGSNEFTAKNIGYQRQEIQTDRVYAASLFVGIMAILTVPTERR